MTAQPSDDFEAQVAPALAVAESRDRRALPAWMLDAAELLAEPDPGPTPWLVENLVVSQAIVALVGRWKTTKSYAFLYLLMCVALGEPAWGLATAGGPVVYVCEESGRAALWRRLDSLARGHALDPEQFREKLYVAANARVRLDDPGYQKELIAIGQDIQPRMFGFDPLARMKAATREENAQKDMAPVIEYLRDLRDETQAAVGFVHHTGHVGQTMRGSSDLESVWESRLAWHRNGQDALVEIHAEHREAEAPAPLKYRISWDHDTRTMRFPLVQDDETPPPLRDRLLAYVREHPKEKAREIATAVDVRGSDVDRELAALTAEGLLAKGRSGRLDSLGREIRDEVYTVAGAASQPLFSDTPGTSHGTSHSGAPQARTNQDEPHPQTRTATPSVPRPSDGTNQDEPPTGHRGSVPRPTPLRGDEPGRATGRATHEERQ